MYASPILKYRLVVIALCAGIAACATVDIEGEIRRLEARLVQAPDDAETLRELGVFHLRAERYARANDYLERAFRQDETDPKTLFHLGLVQEKLGKPETALRLYERYATIPPGSEYRQRMEGRYRWLEREQLHEEMRALAAEWERTLDGTPGSTNPRVVAVYPLTFQGEDDRYAPLSRGLSEMITTDLANVRTLTLVERVRLQTLLDELALAERVSIDPATRPRVGRLIGAGRVIGGVFDVTADRSLSVDLSLLAVEDASEQGRERHSGALRNVFALEKQIVFAIIDRLGIELTQEERDRIEFIPTQDLQAFLAYSRGLLEEDQGNFAAAAGYYQQATRHDPNFQAAAARRAEMESLDAAKGETDDVLSELYPPSPTVDVQSERMNKLNENIGATIYPGQESRKSPQEAAMELPAPPPPPANE